MGFLSALNLGGNSYKLKPGNFYECQSMEQWNALTQEQQDEYDYVLITGDEEEQDLTNAYLTTDSAVSTIAQGDYIPILKTDNSKKKVLWSTIIAKIKSALGTSAAKNSTNEVTSGSTDLVESGAVYTEIQTLTTSLTNVTNSMNILGAKNLLPNKGTTQVVDGVTFTVNSDGSVTASGTANHPNSYAAFYVCDDVVFPAGTYIKSGCPSGGSIETYGFGGNSGGTDIGQGASYTSDGVTARTFIIYVMDGVTINETFYPMLRPSSFTDDTYEPYSMTNRQLTPHRASVKHTFSATNTWETIDILVNGVSPSKVKLIGAHSDSALVVASLGAIGTSHVYVNALQIAGSLSEKTIYVDYMILK